MRPAVWTLSGFADEISPDLSEQCDVLTELGIRYVELRSAWGNNVLDLDDHQLASVVKTLQTREIGVSSIGSPIGKIGVGDDFDAHLIRFNRALHVSAVLGAPYIRLFSFFIPDDDAPEQHRDEVLHQMAALAAAAKGHQVTLVHENEKHIYGDTPARCLDIVESVGSEQLKLAWDPANFVQCGIRPYTVGYQMLRPHIDYIQIKDALLADGTVVPAGDGDGEVATTLAALRADGFDGFFSMEPHLKEGEWSGGFSGPELFRKATRAFTGILADQTIEYC